MKDLKQAAKEFCEVYPESIQTMSEIYDVDEEFFKLNLLPLLEKFAQHMVDKGDLITYEDWQRFKDEYTAEVNCDALCCAVAEVEMEHEKIEQSNQKHIDNLENQVKEYQKMIDLFIDSKKVITDEEIERAAYSDEMEVESDNKYETFIQGAKWYRDQLNKSK